MRLTGLREAKDATKEANEALLYRSEGNDSFSQSLEYGNGRSKWFKVVGRGTLSYETGFGKRDCLKAFPVSANYSVKEYKFFWASKVKRKGKIPKSSS